MKEKTKLILDEINRVIVGKEEVVKKVLIAVLAGGHILLEDVPGVGKTTLALSFSRVLGLDYKRIQFTPDSLPSDIIGFSVYKKETERLEYIPGAVMTNLVLADEINRTSSKTQSALLEVMEEGRVTIDGITRELEKPFVVIATQNPAGSIGTQALPVSQLDRFMVKLHMGYPDTASLIQLMKDRHTHNPVDELQKQCSKAELMAMQKEVENVCISDEIYEYISRLIEQTRNKELIQLGISPRGALALCKMAKAYAYVSGREYVIPEDIIAVFMDVCGHRLILDTRARIENQTAESIVKEIIREVSVPAI